MSTDRRNTVYIAVQDGTEQYRIYLRLPAGSVARGFTVAGRTLTLTGSDPSDGCLVAAPVFARFAAVAADLDRRGIEWLPGVLVPCSSCTSGRRSNLPNYANPFAAEATR